MRWQAPENYARSPCGRRRGRESASEWQVHELFERVYARRAEPEEADAALAFLSAEAARTAEPPEAPAWRYGYGFLDAAEKRVQFTDLPHFARESWQGGDKLPDAKIGWVMLKIGHLPPVYPCLVAAVFTLWSAFHYYLEASRQLRRSHVAHP